jgi:uncharacterized protein YbaR (Trm112 family)|tara:strand:- start:200 stop:463 length:264 start_codon:yes stop_codon:yes gene_type:complete
MDSNLLEVLVCPLCKGPLQHDKANHELICKADRLAFPVRDGIPVMLENEARDLHVNGADATNNAPGTPNPAAASQPSPPDSNNTPNS